MIHKNIYRCINDDDGLDSSAAQAMHTYILARYVIHTATSTYVLT